MPQRQVSYPKKQVSVIIMPFNSFLIWNLDNQGVENLCRGRDNNSAYMG